MKTTPSALAPLAASAVALALLSSGCGKKESPAPAAESQPTNAPPMTAPGAAPAANRPTVATDAGASLAAAQTAMRAKDYEQAAAALLAVQQLQQPLTTAQGEALRNQMEQLQQSVASGLASGDPKAKAAADMLRRSTMR